MTGETTDGYIREINNEGDWQKTVMIGGPGGSTSTFAITVYQEDSSVYVVGTTTSTSFYGLHLPGDQEAFLSKYSSNLELLWTVAIFPLAVSEDVAVNSNGNVFATGYTSAPTYGNSKNKGGFDVFVAEYSAAGILLGGTWFGSAGNDQPASVVIDSFNNIFISGVISTAYNISSTASYVFLAKFEATQFPNETTAGPTGNPFSTTQSQSSATGNLFSTTQFQSSSTTNLVEVSSNQAGSSSTNLIIGLVVAAFLLVVIASD